MNKSFTYYGDKSCESGSVVMVEFRRKQIWGVIIDILPEEKCEIATEKIKEIIAIHPFFRLSSRHIEFIKSLAAYNLAPLGLVLKSFVGILNSDKTKNSVKKIDENDLSPNGNKKHSFSFELQKFELKKLTLKQEEILRELLPQCGFGNEKTLNSSNQNQTNKPSVSLLDGATGSGKTEIYFALIAKILAQNPQAQILILLPEIALTSQLLARFVAQFKFQPAIWHSKTPKKAKREAFLSAADGSLSVMIGARSALLLPFKNLKLVVIDEEHDQSFKQEEIFNFHARDMAILRAKIENFAVILSSATPSLETYYNVKIGKFHSFSLDQEFGSKNEIEMVDMRKEKLAANRFLSSKLKSELVKNLENGQQSLLFLNRRGYAPVSLCKACGTKYSCPNCDAYLVLHKNSKDSRFICHRCGYQESASSDCKFCKAKDSIISLGAGVEKIHEEVKNFLPNARILVIDSDNVSTFFHAEDFVAKISGGEVDIIIGTQMIAKGYDFAKLNLVGIVDADSMLYSSDLRALERAFQMLTQVIGRSGRRRQIGKVLIQSFEPENLLFEKILKNNKKDFYEFELENRKKADFPPFSQMARIEISAVNEEIAKNFAKKLITNFPYDERIEIYGPAPAALWKVRNRYYFWLHLKLPKNLNMQKLISDVFIKIEIPGIIKLKININP